MSAQSAHAVKEIRVANPEELMLQYKATGDLELRNRLVMHYLQYVNTAIFGMRSILLSNIPYDDFFNQGILALMDCIERYDPTLGASFDTYSYLGIRGAILKYLRKQNRLSNRLWEARKKISQSKTALEQELLREPTTQELADRLDMTEAQLGKVMLEISVIDTVSFEDLLESAYDGVPTAGGTTENEAIEGLLRGELRKALAESIEALPVKQRQVITLYYYENLNLREIGDVLDISPQRISQIRKKALEQMAAALRRHGYEYHDSGEL